MRPASDALATRRGGGAVRPAMAGGSQEADDEARAAGQEPGAVVARGGDGVKVSSVEVDEPDGARGGRRALQPEVVFVAVLCAVATIAIGVYPEPLFNVARDAGSALQSLL
jgi:NADH-quinone oxidoreductase subunit N